jgi:hypothetical protein
VIEREEPEAPLTLAFLIGARPPWARDTSEFSAGLKA